MTSPDDSAKRPPEVEALSWENVLKRVPSGNSFKTKPATWLQKIQGNMAMALLCAILLAIAVILGAWLSSYPTLDELRVSLGLNVADSAQRVALMDIFKETRSSAYDQFRNMSELFIGTTLLPLFTLVAGWAFGSKAAGREN